MPHNPVAGSLSASDMLGFDSRCLSPGSLFSQSLGMKLPQILPYRTLGAVFIGKVNARPGETLRMVVRSHMSGDSIRANSLLGS